MRLFFMLIKLVSTSLILSSLIAFAFVFEQATLVQNLIRNLWPLFHAAFDGCWDSLPRLSAKAGMFMHFDGYSAKTSDFFGTGVDAEQNADLFFHADLHVSQIAEAA